MKGFPDLPPIWMASFGGLQWALGFVTPVLIDPGIRWIGAGVIGLGLALILWSALQFIRFSTPIEPHHDPKALIETGPFAMTRNPIYVAMLLILTGWTLWIGVIVGLLAVPVFRQIIDLRFVRDEETRLRAAFGPKADDYIARTRRWIFG